MSRVRLVLVVAGVLLAGIVLVWADPVRLPLPWRGILTRWVWQDYLFGPLPPATCRPRPWVSAPMRIRGRALPLTERLPTQQSADCITATPDSTVRVQYSTVNGWVYNYWRTWIGGPTAGRAVFDSLHRALTARYGNPTYCLRTDWPDAAETGVFQAHWKIGKLLVGLRASADRLPREAPTPTWYVNLEARYYLPACVGGA